MAEISTPKDDISIWRIDIESLVAEGRMVEALNLLQDFVRNYAPAGLRRELLALRGDYDARPASGLIDSAKIEAILLRVLDIAYQTETYAIAGLQAAETSPLPVPRGKTPQPDTRNRANIVLDCENVSRTFPGGRFALQPLSFSLSKGEILGIVGRNSSGKTSLLNILAGLIKPDTGKVIYHGLSDNYNDWLTIKSQIAYVSHNPSAPYGVISEILTVLASSTGLERKSVPDEVEWYLTRYGLKRFASNYGHGLSAGYKLRYALVCALITRPSLVILDEPLANLDVIAIQRFLADLRSLADATETPLPIIVTSQHLGEIESISDQIIMLENGACRYIGTPAGIASTAEYRMVEITIRRGVADIASALAGLNWQELERYPGRYLLAFMRNQDLTEVFNRLSVAFGEDFTSLTDITSSTRALMSEVQA